MNSVGLLKGNKIHLSVVPKLGSSAIRNFYTKNDEHSQSTHDEIDLDKLTSNPTCIIIGPEGDFSEQERDEILKYKDVQPIKINENILRSETAVISSLSIINYLIN